MGCRIRNRQQMALMRSTENNLFVRRRVFVQMDEKVIDIGTTESPLPVTTVKTSLLIVVVIDLSLLRSNI